MLKLCRLYLNQLVFYFNSRRKKGLEKEIMASDASHMLEAALEQMDGIIAGRIIFEPPNFWGEGGEGGTGSDLKTPNVSRCNLF